MLGHVSPGQSIPATEDESQDVDIPRLAQADSPSFASQATDIPAFKFGASKGTGPQLVDLTEQDKTFGIYPEWTRRGCRRRPEEA